MQIRKLGLLAACLSTTIFAGPAAPPATLRYSAQVLDADYEGFTQAPGISRYLLWGSDAVIRYSDDGEHWQQAQLPIDARGLQPTATIHQIRFAETPRTIPRAIAVGENGLILYSDDLGRHWVDASPAGYTAPLNDVRPLGEDRWIAVSANGDVLSSADRGLHWSSSASFLGRQWMSITPLPDGEGALIGGRDGDYLLWTDADDRPQPQTLPVGNGPLRLNRIVAAGKQCLALASNGQILVSDDRVRHWTLIQAPTDSDFAAADFDAESMVTVAVSRDGHLQASRGKNGVFEPETLPIAGEQQFITAIRHIPDTHRWLIFGHAGLLLQSDDDARHWQQLSQSPPGDYEAVWLDPVGDRILIAGRRGYQALFDDRLQHGQLLETAKDHYWRQLLQLADGALLMAGEQGKMLLSTTAGDHWNELPLSFPDPRTPPTFRGLLSTGKSVVAAGPTGLIMTALPDASGWQVTHHTRFDRGEAFTTVVSDPSDPMRLLAVEALAGPYFSADGGWTWQRRQPIADSRNAWRACWLEADAAHPGARKVLVTGQRGLVQASTITDDADNTPWQNAGPDSKADFYGCHVSKRLGAVFIFGSDGALWRSSLQTPQQWQRLHSGTAQSLLNMIEVQDRLLALGNQGTLLSSSDGNSWQAVDVPVRDDLRNALQAADGTLFISGKGGVLLRSQDQGRNWQQLDSHTRAGFRDLLLEPHTGRLIATGERIVLLAPQPAEAETQRAASRRPVAAAAYNSQ